MNSQNYFAVCEFRKDGRIFPVEIGIDSEKTALSRLSWMKFGSGHFEDWRIITMAELKAQSEKIDLSCFTKEAQAEKWEIINAA